MYSNLKAAPDDDLSGAFTAAAREATAAKQTISDRFFLNIPSISLLATEEIIANACNT